MRLLAVLLVRAAEADVRPHGDERRARIGEGRLDGARDRRDVVAVLDPLGVPFVGVEAEEDVLVPGHRGRPIELDVVVVVQEEELAEAQVAGQARRFGRDPLLEVAVRADPVRPVVDDGVARPVELGGQPSLGDRHPDGVGEALAERPGRRLDPGRETVFRVARASGCPTGGTARAARAGGRSP